MSATTVETIIHLKRGFEDLNYYPMENYTDEELHNFFFTPSLVRIQLLKWCLSSLDGEMEKHLNNTDEFNLEQEIVKQVVLLGFCPLGKQENIILGCRNMELQVILWRNILDTLTKQSQMKMLKRPAIDKHSQFLKNVMVNSNLKKLLHSKVQILPAVMQSYYIPASREEAEAEAKEVQRKLKRKVNNIRQRKSDSTSWCLNTMGMEELKVSREKFIAEKNKFCDLYVKSLKLWAMQVKPDKQVEWFDEAILLVENNICRLMQLGSNQDTVMKKMSVQYKSSENTNIR